jgi:hypothetical protein
MHEAVATIMEATAAPWLGFLEYSSASRGIRNAEVITEKLTPTIPTMMSGGLTAKATGIGASKGIEILVNFRAVES